MRLDDALAMNPDYIVVGGGAAGCAVAGRLSEDPSARVLLLEAGRSADDPRVRIPVGVPFLVGNPKWDWMWQTDPDPTINGRRFTWSAGKCLGGGSSIHGQVNIRGLPRDFDDWAAIIGGGSAWSYRDLLPYFVRCESYESANSPFRGSDGPLAVSDIRDPHPLADAFIAAGESLGYPRVDLNGETPEGFGMTQAAQKNGRRFNAYDGYIRPNLGRPNLKVLTGARVLRVILENGEAIGVEVSRGSSALTVRAQREVILSSGAIASAMLLMRSGVGPAEVLHAADVPVRIERPGVGQNLQEHTGVSVSRFIKDHWSLNTAKRPDRALRGMYQLLVKRRGPLASPVVQAMGYVKTDPRLEHPDLQLHFLPFAYKLLPDSRSALTAYMPKRAAVAMQLTLCKPYTRGRVRITSQDPLSPPVIEHHLLDDRRDLDTMVKGCELLTGMFEHPRFASSIVENFNPPENPRTAEEWERFVRDYANVAYHQSGTCRMGAPSDPEAVVDPQLRVIGAARLRVVDASVMPTVPSANTYVPSVVVGEKASDLIRSGAGAPAPAERRPEPAER